MKSLTETSSTSEQYLTTSLSESQTKPSTIPMTPQTKPSQSVSISIQTSSISAPSITTTQNDNPITVVSTQKSTQYSSKSVTFSSSTFSTDPITTPFVSTTDQSIASTISKILTTQSFSHQTQVSNSITSKSTSTLNSILIPSLTTTQFVGVSQLTDFPASTFTESVLLTKTTNFSNNVTQFSSTVNTLVTSKTPGSTNLMQFTRDLITTTSINAIDTGNQL
jgi:hypothetical protein